MEIKKHTLEGNVGILKTKVSKHAFYGLLIAASAIILATLLVAYIQYNEVNMAKIILAQKTNVALWMLDLTPFLFSLWGQYVSSVVSYEAGAMVLDQTNELRMQTSALESQVMHEAMHDGLTELPNRLLFLDRLVQAITVARTEKKQLSVFIIDINHFKEINDALGHHCGDKLLKQIAIRLQAVIRKPNTVARLSADEFAVLLPTLTDAKKEAIQYANKIQKALAASFTLEELTLDIHAALGIALYPEHGLDADTLIQRSGISMYVSKQNNTEYTVYSPKFDRNSPRKLILMGELRQAIDNNSLVLHYQPKIDMGTGNITSAEALVRWHHSEFGLMPPDDFIPLAERTGLIKPLTQWVLNEGFAQCTKWHKSGMNIGLSLNLSTVDILDVELPDTIRGLLAAHELDPKWVKLELTESAFMRDQQRGLEILNHLAAVGIKISIDDFGTGYSSLSYLSKLPVSEVKIDKSFVMNMLKNKDDEVIVRATIDLAHNLGLQVVAEGVCEQEIYTKLAELGCDVAQGFYISKPKEPQDLFDWATTKQPANDSIHEIFQPKLADWKQTGSPGL